MFRIIVQSALCALVALPMVAAASPVIRVGDTVAIGALEVVNGDWYSAGGTVTASGAVKGDAYLAGGTITINTPVGQDLVVVGGTVRVHSDVGDDVRIAAGDTTIAGKVAGDLIVLGGTVHLTNTSTVTGDVLVYGGTLVADGVVQGSVFGAVDTVTLNGRIDGATRFTHVITLALGSAANLKGTLTYTAAHELTQESGARITGEVTYTQTAIPGIDSRVILNGFFACAIVAFAFHFLFHKHLSGFVARTRMRWGITLLVGAGMFLATPLLAIISMATGFGAFLGIALLALYLLMMVMALAFLSVLLGAYTMRLYSRTLEVTVVTTVLGAAVTTFLVFALPSAFVPFLLVLPLGLLTLEMYAALFGKMKGRG